MVLIPNDPRLSLGQRLFQSLLPLPQDGGILTGADRGMLARQGLFNVAGALLQAGSPQAAQRGTLGNIGFALSNLDLPGAVQSAARMRLVTQEIQNRARERDKRAEILGQYAPPANETPLQTEDRLRRMTVAFQSAGLMDDAKEIATSIGQLRPADLKESDGLLYRGPTGEVVGQLPQQPGGRAAQQDYFTRADQLYGQFLQQTTKERDIALNYNAVIEATGNPSPAGDMALIFSFMKMLDPGSTVREGEFATAANTGSIPQRVWAQYNRAVNGERLTSEQRVDFLRQAQNRARGAQRSLGRVIQEYGRRGARFGLNPADVAYDYFSGLAIPGDSSAPSSQNPPPGLVGPTQDDVPARFRP